MSTLRASLVLAALLAAIVSSPADAGVYKCIDSGGGITYAQTPCPAQVSTAVSTSSSSPSADTGMQCDHAAGFSRVVARSMKRGKRSADLFADFGGFDTLSKSAVNIINYVYVFQHSTDVTEERIATLTDGKCKARSFGDVRCEALPPAYVNTIGGCTEGAETNPDARLAATPLPEDGAMALARAETESARMSRNAATANARELEARSTEARDDCRDRAQDSIDRINARMRAGYSSSQGERYRQQLRSLRAQKNGC